MFPLVRELKGGGDGNRTRVQGFAGPCLSHSATPPSERASRRLARRLAGVKIHPKPRYRADDGIRTRDPHLGKVMLYQLSHVRMPVRGYLGPVRRISPALRQNFIRSSRNHQLKAAVGGKNLSLECRQATLPPPLPQLRRPSTGTRPSFGMIIRHRSPRRRRERIGPRGRLRSPRRCRGLELGGCPGPLRGPGPGAGGLGAPTGPCGSARPARSRRRRSRSPRRPARSRRCA
jgi:hypothetical protein